MASESPEERELRSLNAMKDAIVRGANNEKKLEQALQKHLAPFVAMGGSESAKTRVDVIRFAQSIKNLIGRSQIILPVGALIAQYKRPDASPIVRQLASTFITLGVDRMDDYDRSQLIKDIATGISALSSASSASLILRVLLRIIPTVKIPSRGSQEDGAFRSSIGLSASKDANWVASWMGKVLLLKLPNFGASDKLTRDEGIAKLAPFNKALLKDELDFLCPEWRDGKWVQPYDDLPNLRRKIAQLLASGAFTDREKLIPAIFAASNTDSRVSELGDDILKRTTVSFDDAALAKDLFSAHGRMTAPYRTRILGLLSKSPVSTSMEKEIATLVDLDSGINCPEPLQPASNLERIKLHRALFVYIAFIALHGPSQGDFAMGSSILGKIRGYVESRGWPVPHDEVAAPANNAASASNAELRGQAYEVIGLLAKATKMNLREAFSLAQWLFQSLSEDPTSEVAFNIESALSSMLRHFNPDKVDRSELAAVQLGPMLYKYLTLPDGAASVRSARSVAVKWANSCFPFSDPDARWTSIIAIAGKRDESHDVVEEGKRGLDPWAYRVQSVSEIPDWVTLLRVFFYPGNDHGNLAQTMTLDPQGALPVVGGEPAALGRFEGEHIHAFSVAVKFVKQMLLLTALPALNRTPDWAAQLDLAMSVDVKTRGLVQEYLGRASKTDVALFLKACLDGALSKRTKGLDAVIEESLRCFVDVGSLATSGELAWLAAFAADVFPLTASHNKDIRRLAAQALGILGAHPTNTDPARYPALSQRLLTDCTVKMQERIASWETAFGSDAYAVEGSVLALGHLYSRVTFYGEESKPDAWLPRKLLNKDSESGDLQNAAMEAFGQLWSARQDVPVPGSDLSPDSVIEALRAKAESGNERAIFALGRLAIGLEDEVWADVPRSERSTESSNPVESVPGDSGLAFPDKKTDNLDNILRVLYSLETKRETEIHFAIGEAITATVGGWDSEAVSLQMDVDHKPGTWQIGAREKRLQLVLMKLFKDCRDTAPFRLKAAGIWLFCTIQHLGHLPLVRQYSRQAQAAFMRLLNARDELVQETASRGLSLLHDRGNAQEREDLVKDLVNAFTGDSTQLKVEGDTELFEPGALPTGEGKSVTSYKDIIALANEVGDQSLVYKFMSLASNAATWSTRSAFGRFGLSSILTDATVDPRIYPKLYRYRFDPNKNVRASMEEIWKSLVKDPNEAIQKHFDAIMSDLLKCVLGKEWRTRQASAAAISEIIGGQPFKKYEQYYEQIWTAALKVLDDVKSSVREVALKLCMGLTSTIVRLLEDGSSVDTARVMLGQALRFLLSSSGLESNVDEVKGFSLKTIMDVTKKGGKALKPYVAEIIPHLLNLHSTVEPEQINFAYQRLQEDKRGQLDKMRASFVNTSPITEAIDNCLRQVDDEIMTQLVPSIEQTVKSAIGMQTKIGCARLFTDMVMRHRHEIEPYASKFLQMMEKQVLDRNDEVSQAYAKASAYLMRVAPEASKDRFITKAIDLYFDAEDDNRRQKMSNVILALSTASPDVFNELESRLLPFAFMASHDTDEWVKKAFTKVWDAHAGSSRTVARYVEEIVAFARRGLDAPRWVLQHSGAFTIASTIKDVVAASDANGQISDANLKLIWPVLDKALALKTFTHKEKLLASFPVFVGHGKRLWQDDAGIAAQMKKIALREAKRNNDAYRVHALTYLWKFAEVRDDLDLLDDIFAIVKPFLDEVNDEDRMDVDSEDKATAIAKSGLEAVARGYNRQQLQQDSYGVLDKMMRLLRPYLGSAQFAVMKREVWYECVRDVVRAAVPGSGSSSSTAASEADKAVATTYLLSLDMDQVDVGTEAQRNMRAQAMGAVFAAKGSGVFGPAPEGAEKAQLVAMVENALGMERSLEVQAQLKTILSEMK
ncbi:hypothetical protein VD0004_g1783 [Verticillium dahliae]|nr:hypothetical protein VD0004_g1783 [Verticillium dahliae]PNH75684.1 hypothetical protein VD0001_g1858 [Verticillium dahliae]